MFIKNLTQEEKKHDFINLELQKNMLLCLRRSAMLPQMHLHLFNTMAKSLS